MEFLTRSDFLGNTCQIPCFSSPEAVEPAEWAAVFFDPASLPAGEGGYLIPEQWQRSLPGAELMVSSAASGGDLRQHFREAVTTGRPCWLLMEPMAAAFPLPCPDGQGRKAPQTAGDGGFFSQTLGCRYTHTPEEAVLYDTAETLEKKLQWAREAGFQGFLTME